MDPLDYILDYVLDVSKIVSYCIRDMSTNKCNQHSNANIAIVNHDDLYQIYSPKVSSIELIRPNSMYDLILHTTARMAGKYYGRAPTNAARHSH